MLTANTRLRLQDIIGRIAESQPISLNERIYVQKFADRDASVWSWLRRAQRQQRSGEPAMDIEHFMEQMDLGEPVIPRSLTPTMTILATGSPVRPTG